MEQKRAFRLMGLLSRQAVLDVNQYAASYHLDNQLYLYLIRIVEAGTLTASVLAEQVKIEKSTLSRALQKLEKAGYIERQQDPENKKFYLLSATPAGRSIVAPVQKFEEDLIEARMASLTPKEVRTLRQILEKMTQE